MAPQRDNSASPHLTASQWRQIVNSASDTAIISTDPNGFVTSWNSGAERIFGWIENEMLGERLSRLFTEEDRTGGLLEREISSARNFGMGGGEEGWRLRKDGSSFWAVGELSPIRDGGSIVGDTKIVRDRTVQREAEEAIREERHALELLNRAGSALAIENDVKALVQIVTDAGVELSGAQFGAFFYNLINDVGESYMLTRCRVPQKKRSQSFRCPATPKSSRRPSMARASSGRPISQKTRDTAIMSRERACPKATCQLGATSLCP